MKCKYCNQECKSTYIDYVSDHVPIEENFKCEPCNAHFDYNYQYSCYTDYGFSFNYKDRVWKFNVCEQDGSVVIWALGSPPALTFSLDYAPLFHPATILAKLPLYLVFS